MTKSEAINHLNNSTLKIESYNSIGSGFFIAQGLVITCYHVIKGFSASELEITWQGKTYRATSIKENPDDDLALIFLKIDQKHPCVQIDSSIELDNECYSFGYSTKRGDVITFKYEGTDGEGLLKFKDGLFQSGLSGSPILNLQTLKVCAVVKRTRDNEFPIGGRGISISKILDFKSLELGDNGSIFSKEMFKNWVWVSSIKSADRLQFSILALFETLLAVSGSFYLWIYYDFYWHIVTGLVIAPLFFLRTKKSERDAIALLLMKIKKEKEKKNLFFSLIFILFYIVISIRYSYSWSLLLFLIVFTFFHVFISIIIKKNTNLLSSSFYVLILISIFVDYYFNLNYLEFMFFKIKEYGDPNIAYNLGQQSPSTAFLMCFIILRFTIYAFFIRVYITIKNLSLSSIIVIPKNWFKLILSTDFFHLPEILPCLESAKISHKLMTYSYLKASFVFSKKRISNKYSKFNKYIKINHKENNFQENNSLMFIINKVSNFIYIILINPFKNFFILIENIFILIGYIFTTLFDVFFEVLLLGLNFIFSFVFRYSLKSTAWIYLPLIWLIQPQNKYDLMTRMKIESKNFIAYLMFFYSVIVVFIFTLLPLLFPDTKIGIYVQTFGLPDTLKTIFFAYEFNFWHLTRFLSALITIVFMFSFTKILIKRETQPSYGNFWAAKLLSLRRLRGILTLITLGFTVYHILGLLPEHFFRDLWENMIFMQG